MQNESRGIGGRGFFAQPLFYVDGVRVTRAGALRALAPADIERVEVVKGSAAEGRFGEGARNGVIVITTRKN